MSQLYLERRYLQFRIILVTTVVFLVVQGVIWFSGLLEGVEGTWVIWVFDTAAILFIFAFYKFGVGTLELWQRIRDHQSLLQEEQQVLEKEFYPEVAIFVLACVLFLFVVYRLIH